MTDLHHRSGLEIAEGIRSGDLSSVEATRYFLDRIAEHDGGLSAFVTVLRRRALAAAQRSDRARRRGDEVPLLSGVPTAIKDLVPMFGTPSKMGSRAYRYFVSPIDALAARRMKAAGLVILGKLATSEFGVLPVTEPDIHPPTRNPWKPAHSAGGSSGGSGSAVAAGFVPFAHGSDGGGSVRIPATLCHLFGFKPSLSLLGNMHGRVNILGMSVMGPLAHTVEDAAALLDALNGETHRGGAVSLGSCLAACQRPVGRLRIRVSTESPVGDVEPEMAEATQVTARLLEELGHDVEPAEMVKSEMAEFMPLWQSMLAAVPSPSERVLQPVTQWLRKAGRQVALADAKSQQKMLAQRIEAIIGDADVLLTPTAPVFAPKIGEHKDLPAPEHFAASARLGEFTAPFNITNGPAVTIPTGISTGGLPIGVQLGARVGDDRRLFALSRQLEEAMPWRQRRAM